MTFYIMRIKLRQLSHFVAVCRHGNFRRAAEAEYLSQPALSRSIQNLEESLGVPLFDRLATEVTLTRYGEAFAPRAEALLVDAADLEREISLMTGMNSGRFSVAMGEYASGLSGMSAVGQLLAAHPGLQVRVELRGWREIERMVRSRQVDIGFGEISHLEDVPDLRVESVAHHQLVAFCRPGHPLLNKTTPISFADLDSHTFVGPPFPTRLAKKFPRNARIDEETRDILPPIVAEGSNAAAEIVAVTDAIGASIPHLIEPLVQSGRISIVPIAAPWFRVDYGFIQLASRSLSPATAAFMTQVMAIERKLEGQNQALLEAWTGDLVRKDDTSAPARHKRLGSQHA